RLTRPDLDFLAVVHADDHPPTDHVAVVIGLARIRAGDRLDMLRPLPARLVLAEPDVEVAHFDEVHLPCAFRESARLVRLVKTLLNCCGSWGHPCLPCA